MGSCGVFRLKTFRNDLTNVQAGRASGLRERSSTIDTNTAAGPHGTPSALHKSGSVLSNPKKYVLVFIQNITMCIVSFTMCMTLRLVVGVCAYQTIHGNVL